MSSSESGQGIGRKAQAAIHDVTTSIKGSASQAAARAREMAGEVAQEQQNHMAGKMDTVSAALDETAGSVRPQDPNIAWLTEQASARLQTAAEYVRSASWERLRHDGQDLARRHPWAFFGGMFAVGVVAGAIVKAGVQSGTSDAARQEPDLAPTPELGEPATASAAPSFPSPAI